MDTSSTTQAHRTLCKPLFYRLNLVADSIIEWNGAEDRQRLDEGLGEALGKVPDATVMAWGITPHALVMVLRLSPWVVLPAVVSDLRSAVIRVLGNGHSPFPWRNVRLGTVGEGELDRVLDSLNTLDGRRFFGT